MAAQFQVDTGGTLTTSLSAYYKMGSSVDCYGSNTLANVNAVTFTAAKVNNGATFVRNGTTTQRLWIASNSTLTATGGITIAGWLYITDPTLTNAVLGKWGGGGSYEYVLYTGIVTGSQLTFGMTPDTNPANQVNVTASNFGNLSANTWYFVAMGYDDTNHQSWISINNGTKNTTSITLTSVGAADFVVGASANSADGNAYGGKIDELGVWKKTLSSQELTDLYNSGNAQTLIPNKHFQTDTNSSLNEALVSYYKLGDTIDFYGSNTLTNNGTVTFTSGKYNNGADMGSSNTTKWLSVTNDMGIQGGAGSIAGWFKISTAPATNAYNFLAQVSDAGTKTALDIIYRDISGTPTLALHREHVGGTNEGVSYTQTLTIGTWYHLAVTYDATNVRAYLNGSQIGSATPASGDGPYAGTIDSFGLMSYTAIGGGFNQGASGMCDEVGVWTKALSAQEITDLYNSGNGQTMNPPIEFGGATFGQDTTTTTLTFSSPNVSGSNTIGFLYVAHQPDDLTSVQWNGSNMTSLATRTTAGTTHYQWLYYILNPTAGVTNITVSATTNGGNISAGALYYIGAKQEAPTPVTTQSEISASGITGTLTTTTDNCWTIMGIYANGDTGSKTAGAGTILRLNDSGFVAKQAAVFDSGAPISPAASTSLIASGAASTYSDIMAAFAPAPAVTTNTTNFFFMF